jgi:hypothetical protein
MKITVSASPSSHSIVTGKWGGSLRRPSQSLRKRTVRSNPGVTAPPREGSNTPENDGVQSTEPQTVHFDPLEGARDKNGVGEPLAGGRSEAILARPGLSVFARTPSSDRNQLQIPPLPDFGAGGGPKRVSAQGGPKHVCQLSSNSYIPPSLRAQGRDTKKTATSPCVPQTLQGDTGFITSRQALKVRQGRDQAAEEREEEGHNRPTT